MTSINHAEVAETLHRAADLIEERGWVRGSGWVTPSRASGPLCLEGGIMAALGLQLPDQILDDRLFAPLVTCPAYRAVSAYLEREEVTIMPSGGMVGGLLYRWNDESARTAAEVVEVLRAAAAIEQAKHDAELPPIRFEDGSWSVILPAGWRAATVKSASDTEDAWVTSW